MIVKRETPRCLIAAEEEVTNVQLFTSRQIRGNVPKDRVIFGTFLVCWLMLGKGFAIMGAMIRF